MRNMTTQELTRYFVGIGVISNILSLGYLGSDFSALFSIGSLIFIGWLFLPYLVWAVVNERHPDSFSKHLRLYIAFAIAMPLIFLYMVSYVVLHPDPQAGFFLIYIPFLQFMCLWVAWMVCGK